MLQRVTDWASVYDNTGNIPDGTAWPGRWVEPARAFREAMQAEGRAHMGLAYGPGPRNRFDLFMPKGAPRGLVVYIHGGFWMQSDRSYWSHLAAGPLVHNFAVAVPEYSLCPTIMISGITAEIGAAITAAASMVAGPIRLVGHSAGGHLASRMACIGAPLPREMQARIARIVSISGLHDLRPLLCVPQCEPLGLDEAEAAAESPALLRPVPETRLTCWAGGAETSEFRRQNALLANIWLGLGAATEAVEEAGLHHFDIVDGLTDAGHPLVQNLLDLG